MEPDMNHEAIIQAAKDYVTALFSQDFSGHDVGHTMRVYRMATSLARCEGADLFTVQLAALLHDADDIKLSPQTYENKDHAVSFLLGQGVDRGSIRGICHIIDQVSFKGTGGVIPDSLEGECVQDADRLDALGAIGIGRAFAYGGSRHRPMYDPDIQPRLHMDEEEYRSNESTTINHFHEKLFKLRALMNTQAAKRMAAKRERFMRDFVDEFLLEWDGER
ncbi:HD domain protein [Parascardovia denticolens DSM 10105 = JCM 12538]|uniref:HD domain protein n=2 Tax=Parascardovia denticolens TaxID=78258 RepID=E6K052_PARDN|nr:hypothetical protein HMPREF9017_01414 [Parascardovia denticolens F0305]EFT84164.1 HD domain protein [Parascardovia denticolens DSM 10105 = JCM 12538]BAR05012.1 phosphohydrolase [Parascardovia denticolens DSM 10105 = JCM 12538]